MTGMVMYHIFLKEEIERQIRALLTTYFTHESGSYYSFTLFLMKKKDGSWRCCTNFRKFNALTIKNRFPVPFIEDL